MLELWGDVVAPFNKSLIKIFLMLYYPQVSFIDFVVYPLWETWAELVYPNAQEVLDTIAVTRNYWSDIADGEVRWWWYGWVKGRRNSPSIMGKG